MSIIAFVMQISWMAKSCGKTILRSSMGKFVEILRFALNPNAALPPSMSVGGPWTAGQWRNVMAVAERQAVGPIVAQGVSRLPEGMKPPMNIVEHWIVKNMSARRRNMRLYCRTVEICRMLSELGWKSCILKGQGNALMYDDTCIRVAGDIDVWTTASKRDVVNMVRRKFPELKNEYHHIEYPVFDDVPVEIHHFPSYMFNPLHNWRMQRYYRAEEERMMDNVVEAPEGLGQFATPDACFNAIFQLSHMFRHVLVQGVGMRHLVDYFYVMKNLPRDAESKQLLVGRLKKMGLFHFAGAVMYVEREWLGLDDGYLLVKPDEKRGRQLMQCIISGGNFGKYDKGTWLYGKGFIDRQIRKFKRSWNFLRAYPCEVLSEPLFRVSFFVQRKM